MDCPLNLATMPRRPRQCPPGFPVHIVQRGNNRQAIFATGSDLKAYANWLREAAERYDVDIHAWVFMTNHVHLLMTPRAPNAISGCMQYLGRNYVRYFNQRYARSGTLFEGRFKSSIVQTSDYYLVCQRYIELNPVRAGIVTDPASYSWSSYRAHAFNRSVRMWKPHLEYLSLGTNATTRTSVYRRFVSERLSDQSVTEVRSALNAGLALGNPEFKRQIEALTGVRQHHLRRGPRKS